VIAIVAFIRLIVVEHSVELALLPERYVSTPGGRASFSCIPPIGKSVQLSVNGSLVENISLSRLFWRNQEAGVCELTSGVQHNHYHLYGDHIDITDKYTAFTTIYSRFVLKGIL
jgi:hypothetical protein